MRYIPIRHVTSHHHRLSQNSFSFPPPSTQNTSSQRLSPPFSPFLTERPRITSFRPIHPFLTRHLTHASQQAAFTKLAPYSLRNPILNSINVFISSDFRLLELIYIYCYYKDIYIYIIRERDRTWKLVFLCVI